MAATGPPTIPSLKQAFIAAQTTLLSQPLAPSRSWHRTNDKAAGNAVPERALDDALFHLNHTLQKHCRRVYAPQATGNIAEQITDSYARHADQKTGEAVDADGGIGKELDLTDDAVIETLSPNWPSDHDVTAYPAEAKRYAESVSHLVTLSQQRQELKQRVQRLRQIQATIEPLHSSDDSSAGIQENLATRNGPVEQELERMRLLLARVAGRVEQLPAPEPSQDAANIEFAALRGSRKRAVDEFLANSKVFPS